MLLSTKLLNFGLFSHVFFTQNSSTRFLKLNEIVVLGKLVANYQLYLSGEGGLLTEEVIASSSEHGGDLQLAYVIR